MLAIFLLILFASGVQSGSNAQLIPRKGGGGGGGHGGGGHSSGGGRGTTSSHGGGGGATSSPGKSVSVSSILGSKTASSGSRGGGGVVVLPGSSIFPQRLSGGGTRDNVYGTQRIGSGYPYGGYGSFYGGRGFPYGFYPVYYPSPYYGGYYGGNEYGPSANATRPGGELATAVVQPTTANASFPNSTFYIYGDLASVSAVLAALVPKCNISNTSPHPAFRNGTETSDVHPEQAIQYYRASSFVLALAVYNNTATLPINAPATNTSAVPPTMADTPLPGGVDPMLLACINTTIGGSVPMLDVNLKNGHPGNQFNAAWGVYSALLVLLLLS